MKQFDKEIRNKLNSFESPVTPDLWSKIEASRAVNDLEKGMARKSSKIWSMLFIGLCLTSTVVLWNYLDTSENDSTKNNIQINHKEDKKTIKDEATAFLENNLKSHSNTDVAEQKTHLSDSRISSIPLKKDFNTSAYVPNGKKYSKKSNVLPQESTLENNIKTIVQSNDKDNTLEFSGKQENTPNKFSEQNVIKHVAPKAVNNEKMKNYSSVLPVWPHLAFSDKHKKLKLNLSSDFICGNRPKNYPFTYYLDFGFSTDRIIKYFTVTDSYYNDYAQARENTEGFHFAYSINTRLSMVHYTGITFKTGFQFQQTNDFFEYIDDNYTEETEGGVITGPYEIAKYNRYKAYDIPIMLGYELDISNFTFSLNTGIHMNLFFDKSGYFLTPDESWSTFQNDNQVYKNWIGASWATNIGAYFHLTNRTQLMMEPHFNYSLTPLTVENYPIQQKNFSTGMRLGLRFRM